MQAYLQVGDYVAMTQSIQTRRFAKIWYAEASTYNFSINLSMGFVNAFVVKVLGYGLLELGFLTALRTLAVVIGQPVAAMVLLLYRGKRKLVWFLNGALNRVLWALVPFSMVLPNELQLVFLSTLVFIAQFTGGIAGIAAMDCVGSNIPGSMATRVFSTVNKLSYLAIAVSQLIGVLVFVFDTGTLFGYELVYAIALIVALASTALLYAIPDYTSQQSGGSFARWVSILSVIENEKLRRYLVAITLFNFSVSIPAPFWDYIVLSVTGGRELFIPVKNAVNLLAKYAVVDWWQKLAYRHSLKKTLVEGMAFTTLVPVLYLEVSSATGVVIAEAVSGAVWAPVDIGLGVYSTYLPPDVTRPVYLSVVNMVVNGATTIAATLGTILATWSGGVHASLAVSAAMRVLTAGVAYRLMPELEATQPTSASTRDRR